jgi:hypothetical protein
MPNTSWVRAGFLFDVQNHFAYKGQTPPLPDPFGLVPRVVNSSPCVDPKMAAGAPRSAMRYRMN